MLTISILFCININSQSFPGCEGPGCVATGGSGYLVYKVTNLNDSGTGSLRQAVSDAGSAGGGNIVFDVSGVINLSSSLTITSASNLTFAGQTAPEGGITIDGSRVAFIGSSNIVIMHMRFRGGFDYGGDDSLVFKENATNIVVDHVSTSFGGDESFSIYATGSGQTVDNITISRCIMAESSSSSQIVGALYGTATAGDIAVHHNLYYNESHRFPNVAGGSTSNFQISNNIVWTLEDRLTRGNGESNINFEGNYYNYGTRPLIDTRTHLWTGIDGTPPTLYLDGNTIVAANTSTPLTWTASEMNTDNDRMFGYFLDYNGNSAGDRLPSGYFTSTKNSYGWTYDVTVQTSSAAFDDVVADVGTNKRINGDGSVSDNTDALDSAWLSNVDTGTFEDRLSTGSYAVPSITSNSRAASYDTDDDGMPDVWEAATFGDLTTDETTDSDSDGRTNFQEFIDLVYGEEPSPIAVTGIEWDNDDQTVEVGGFLDLTLNWSPSNATDKGFSLVSSNPSVISNAGAVIGEGTATLTITTDDGSFTDVMNVTVNAASEPSPSTGKRIKKGKFILIDY